MLIIEAMLLVIIAVVGMSAAIGMIRTWLAARDERALNDARLQEARARARRIVVNDESADVTQRFIDAFDDVMDESTREVVEQHRADRVIREHSS